MAEDLRIASYATGLSRDGPGVLLDDLRKGKAADTALVAATIRAADPDILLLLDFDYDATGAALDAFAALLGEGAYPHRFARRPNTGKATALDMDGDGRRGGPRDAQGYGEFSGQGGMAVLSRLPFDKDGFTDLSALLWTAYLDNRLPEPPPKPPFVILGISNIDPEKGDGDHAAMAAFLADPRLSDTLPLDALGASTTADFPAPLGPLRVDYILPSSDLAVIASGLSPATENGPVHRLVWVDLHIP